MTAFYLQLHARPTVMRESSYVYPLEVREQVLRWANEVGPSMPRELEFSMLATTPRSAADGRIWTHAAVSSQVSVSR